MSSSATSRGRRTQTSTSWAILSRRRATEAWLWEKGFLERATASSAKTASSSGRPKQTSEAQRRVSGEHNASRTGRNRSSADPKAEGEVPFSHTSWDGWALRVPDNLSSEFLGKISDDVRGGRTLYLTERLSSVFLMFYDLDMKMKERDITLDEGYLLAIGRCAIDTAKPFFPPDAPGSLFDLMISTAPVKSLASVDPSDNMTTYLLKNGVHLHFVHMTVDASSALCMRESLILAARKFISAEAGGGDAWESVIDHQVYMNGLRMMYSHKVVDCSSCHNKGFDKAHCSTCMGVGRMDDERPYRPVLYLRGSDRSIDREKTAVFQANPLETLRASSLRKAEGTARSPGWHMPAGAPMYDLAELQPSLAKHIRRAKTGDETSPQGLRLIGSSVKPSSRGVDIPATDPRFQAIMRLVHSACMGRWSEVQGKRLSMDLTTNCYLLRVYGSGQHYCQNKGADHTGARVYFEISPAMGLVQRCGSRKNELRLYSVCQKYRSPSLASICEQTQQLLFPSLNNFAQKRQILTGFSKGIEAHARAVNALVSGLEAKARNINGPASGRDGSPSLSSSTGAVARHTGPLRFSVQPIASSPVMKQFMLAASAVRDCPTQPIRTSDDAPMHDGDGDGDYDDDDDNGGGGSGGDDADGNHSNDRDAFPVIKTKVITTGASYKRACLTK